MTAVDSQPPDIPASSVWKPLCKNDLAVFAAALGVAALLVISRAVWAPMFGDPGEVQLTAAVGGVGHPPGQAGIISIFRVMCLLLPFEPYLTVCAANVAFALIVVAVLMLVQLRTGVHPAIAALCSFLFLTDDQFWHAATTTETYATCFALLSSGIWFYLNWLHSAGPCIRAGDNTNGVRRSWRVWVAVALLMYVFANRAPTAAMILPIAVATLANTRARAFWASQTVRKFACVFLIGAASLVVMVLSIWVRDVPGCGYNYLDQAGPSQPHYPMSNTNVSDKLERLWWLITARQYDYMFHPTPRTIKGQSLWLIHELGWQNPELMAAGGAVVALGAITLWQRNRQVAWLVFLMIPAAVLPILLIRVVSHTALIPNLMFALYWLIGLGLTRMRTWIQSPIWFAAIIGAVVASVWWIADSSFLERKSEFDAREHIAKVQMESLPAGAMLIDFDVLPLVYMQRVHGIRPDVSIVVPHGRLNRTFLESVHTPVFTTAKTLPSDLNALMIGDGPVTRIQLLNHGER